MGLDTCTSEENAGRVIDLPPPFDPAHKYTCDHLRGLGGPRGRYGIGDFAVRTAPAIIPVLEVRGETGLVLVVYGKAKVAPGGLLPLVLLVKLTAVDFIRNFTHAPRAQDPTGHK